MHLSHLLRPIAILATLALAPVTTRAEDFSADKQAVQEAIAGKLPQTALAILDKLIPRAIAANDDNTAINAILTKAVATAGNERFDSAPLTQIRVLAAYRSNASPALRAMLDAALAHTWQIYYDNNRHRLLIRSSVAAESTSASDAPVRPEHEVILTWDAARVREEIHRYYVLALSAPATLKVTPVTAFSVILKEGSRPDSLRPTLYDFLIHDAIAFYSLAEQGSLQSEDQFEPDANSPLLGNLDEFLAWKPDSGVALQSAQPAASSTSPTAPNAQDTRSVADGKSALPSNASSPVLRAIALYQTLLRFRLADTANPAALADADTSRILWAKEILSNAEGTALRTEQALRAHIERWKHHEASADTAAELALLLRAAAPQADTPPDSSASSPTAALEAYRAASLGIALHPQSSGAKRCRSIIAALEDPALHNFQTESVWNAPLPEISIRYKNLETVHFRAIAANWHDFLARDKNRPSDLNVDELARYTRKAPALEWSASLPKTDYAWRTHRIAAPEGLKPGFYFIVASANKNFPLKNNALIAVPVHVSDLALVTVPTAPATANPGDNYHGYVLNAITGAPVAGATVTAWRLNSERERVKLAPVTTDAFGAFSLKTPDRQRTLLLATDAAGNQITNESGSTLHYNGSHERTPERTRLYIHFLTDRAIYRPGQNVQFKAVVFSANRDTNQYEIAPNRRIVVALADPNNKDAATLELRTNAYGSAHGSFAIPAGRLNGQYALHTTGAENGRGYIRVEEYKRPKFAVALDTPAAAPKLNAPVTLTGTATAYTGAPVDGAKVRWSVTRVVRWPAWCWWRNSFGAPRAIVRGVATTDATGKFALTFPALPDKSADPKDEPVFTYRVSAEVTDSTGETRDATRSVSAGHTALQANVSVADWQTTAKPVSVKITTTTLDGDPVPKTAGQLIFYALKQPDSVHRAAVETIWGGGTSSRNDLADPRNWEEDDGVLTLPVVTDAKGTATVNAPLPAGIYRAVLTSTDRSGTPVTARAEIIVRDPAAPKSAVKVPFSVATEKTQLQPGDTLTALWGSGYSAARALVSIEQRGKIVQQFWTTADRTQQAITFPVTEGLRGGFTFRVWQVRENRFYEESLRISVPWTNKKLDMGWERFRSKLVPGARETWTLKIAPAGRASGPEARVSGARRATALTAPALIPEFAAALYAVSLDQFAAHAWAPLDPFYADYATGGIAFSNALTFARALIGELVPRPVLEKRPAAERGNYRHWDVPGSRDAFAVAGRARNVAYRMRAPAAGDSFVAESASALVSPGFGPVHKSADPAAADAVTGTSAGNSSPNSPALDTIAARTNLRETAFFFPALVAEADGTVRLEFTMPEALTRWKFLAFAHDKQLRSGTFADGSIITAKDFMVQPNPPRFVREGDVIEIPVKFTNKTDAPQTGHARLNFSDALSLDPADVRLSNATPERTFTLPPHSSQTLAWRIRVPDGQGYLVYKAVAAAGLATDGEEGFLPVLSRRQLVTESVAFTVHGNAGLRPASGQSVPETRAPGSATRSFDFPALRASASDTTLRHESLTVQAVSNPAWYAVMALPYLMEYPHECSEQLFNRYYANALARHIANAAPKIARVFEQWKNTPALDSTLFKNEDIKTLLIAETPWVRAAEGESAQRRNIGILFDKNRTDSELSLALKKLAERQRADGRWSWFPDGPANDYITLNIVAGLGHLRQLGVGTSAANGSTRAKADATTPVLKRALPALDAALVKEFERVKADAARRDKDYRDENNLSPRIAFHLYARSLFVTEEWPDKGPRALTDAAYDYYFEQATKYWTTLPIQSQAHIALAAHGWLPHGNADIPPATRHGRPARGGSTDNLVSVGEPHGRDGHATFGRPAPAENAPATRHERLARDGSTDNLVSVGEPHGRDGHATFERPAPAENAPATWHGRPAREATSPADKFSALPDVILRSLRERSKTDPELGTYWPQLTNTGWFWYQAPIETHSLLIEAFATIAPDPAFLDNLRLWLLRQKQTQSWSTTKSTADAIHVLLLRDSNVVRRQSEARVATPLLDAVATPTPMPTGETESEVAGRGKIGESNEAAVSVPSVPARQKAPTPISLLSNDALFSIRLGDRPIVPRNVEPGTGFYTERIPGSAIMPSMGNITVTRTGSGISWGSVTWQYHQSLESIRAHAATPLKLKKTLWKKIRTAKGDELLPVAAPLLPSTAPLVPGDTVVIRLELTTDRDMEFVHLKDQRASGTEPVNVLSGYRWRDGLGHYETTKDTATHFFIDWLPKGTHLFEYPVRVQHRGNYQSGIAEIQSMYAPEFNAHSASTLLRVE